MPASIQMLDYESDLGCSPKGCILILVIATAEIGIHHSCIYLQRVVKITYKSFYYLWKQVYHTIQKLTKNYESNLNIKNKP